MKRGWVFLVLGLLTLVIFSCADKFVTSGKIAMNRKEWDKAISDFHKALDTNPNNDKAHFCLAQCYKEKGDYANMIIHMRPAENPVNAKELKKLREDSWFDLAASADTAMNEIPQLEKGAKEDFENALGFIKIDQPDSASRFFNRTKAKMRIKEKDPAEEIFNLAVEKAKAKEYDEANKNLDLAITTANQVGYGIAKDKFETAIAIDPSQPQAYAKAAFAWFNIGNDDSSYYYYREANRLLPADMGILKNLANIAYKIKKIELVDSLAKTIITADPNNADAHLMIAEIRESSSDFEMAAEHYGKALELRPDQCEVWFKLGVIYFKELKKLENAEQAFTQAVNLCPEDFNAFINLNVVLISQGKFDDAISRLYTFTEKYPQDCTGWDLLSQALVRKGDKAKALDANKKYLECKGETK